ncbi:MAG: ABC transporter permease [Pseudomonadota bacterium]
MRSNPIPFLISLAALVLIWVWAAYATDDPSILPLPWNVLGLMYSEAVTGPLFGHMAATLLRVAAAFSIAMAIGLALGLWLGRSHLANQWFGPWVVVFLNIPALVVIVLCYLWIGLNEVAAIVAVAVNKTAMVTVTMREGAAALDRPLADLSRAFRLSRWSELRHVILPQLYPYVFSSMRNGIAVIWKIVLVVEFLGRPNGVGFQIHLYFQLFETGYVLAYAFSFVALMLLVEYALFAPWERRANAWRAQPV